MPRSLWSGSLSFGLVNVPVALYGATRDLSIRFRQLHEPDGSPIETRRVCVAEDREVPWEGIVRGYEVAPGSWVLLTDEDLAAAAPRRSRTIDIERFVQEREIDPLYFDRPYLLAPTDEGAARAYALLSQTLQDTGKAALGRFVLHAKERLVSIRHRQGTLALTTMRFPDELRSTDEIVEEIPATRPTRKQVERAVAIIEELGVSFDPTHYRDEHRARLQRIVARKRKGEKIPPSPQPARPTTSAPDLMGALEQSLAQIRDGTKGRKRRKPTASPPSGRSESKR